MFAFYSDFDCLRGDKVTLKITEKDPGGGAILPFYYYDIFDNEGENVGKISIRIGNNFHSYYNGHIGYEVFEGYRGNRYAYEAARLVLAVARAHGMKEIYLTCKRSNIASIKTIERLGAVRIEIAEIPRECFFYYDGIAPSCIYSLPL